MCTGKSTAGASFTRFPTGDEVCVVWTCYPSTLIWKSEAGGLVKVQG